MITVKRHGDRWAVLEEPGATPFKEYETRELAEAAARSLAGDDEIHVDDTPDGLGQGEPGAEGGPPPRDAGIDQRTGGGGSGHETPRQGQAGL